MTFSPTGFSHTIFKDRYAFTEQESWTDACKRVAKQMAIAERHDKVERYEQKFFEILVGNYFVPGGRIWYNSGRPNPQLLNCFVLNDDLDSKEGWGRLLYENVVTSMTGGGCGQDFSEVRPSDAEIKGHRGVCPGPVALMRGVNSAAHMVRAGGGRRAANMFSLDLTHPNIENFLDSKLDKGELDMANISVRSKNTLEFIEAIKNDGEIELHWKGKYKKRIKARPLWNKIVENAHKSAEPGFLNMELALSESTIYYIEDLVTTNPCKPLDATILTDKGYITFEEALKFDELKIVTPEGKIVKATKPFKTGESTEVMRVRLSNGRWLKGTPNHRHLSYKGDWVEMGDLKTGDRLACSIIPVLPLNASENEDYDLGVLAGWIWGDGSISSRSISVCFGVNEFDFAEKFSKAYDCLVKPHSQKPDSCKVTNIKGVWHQRILDLPLTFKGNCLDKNNLKWIRGMSANFKLGFLRAYFTADGSVRKQGITALYSTQREALEMCAEVLNEFGIYATVGRRALAKVRSGNYGIRNQAENYVLETFFSDFNKIGFLCKFKNDKLIERKKTNSIRKKLIYSSVRVVEIQRNFSVEDVYDITVDHENHAFLDGSVITHNCGEIVMPAYDSCCLGHIVLTRFIKGDDFDWPQLAKVVTTGIRFLDNVLDVNSYPLPQMREQSQRTRRVGLGSTGLADALAMIGVKYGSEEGNKVVDKLYRFISKAAYEASVMLAVEKGMFPSCKPELHVKSGFMKRMTDKIKSLVEEHGIRNCALLTQAPTGTVSILSGNCSSGIEPMFAFAYWRNYWDGENRARELCFHPLFAEFLKENKNVDHFVASEDISLKDHLEVQKIIQRHLDNAVSKTCIIPEHMDVEEMSRLWLEYLPYLKGTTFYRTGSRKFIDKDGKEHEPPLVAISLEEAKKLFNEQSKNEAVHIDDCTGGACGI